MAAPAHCNLWGHAARTCFNLNHVIAEGKGGGVRDEGFLENQVGARWPGVIRGQGAEVVFCTRPPRDAEAERQLHNTFHFH